MFVFERSILKESYRISFAKLDCCFFEFFKFSKLIYIVANIAIYTYNYVGRDIVVVIRVVTKYFTFVSLMGAYAPTLSSRYAIVLWLVWSS